VVFQVQVKEEKPAAKTEEARRASRRRAAYLYGMLKRSRRRCITTAPKPESQPKKG